MKKNNLKTFWIAVPAFFAIVSCNKTSNELKPIEAKPAKYDISGKFNQDEIVRITANAYLPYIEDTSRITFKWLLDSAKFTKEETKAILVFAQKSGLNIDSIFCREIETNPIKIGFLVNGLNKLFVNSETKKLYLTQVPQKSFTSQFKYKGYYQNGWYSTHHADTTKIGRCKAIIGADGNFEIWLDDALNSKQKITGSFISNDTTCLGCKLEKQGISIKYTLNLIDSADLFFIERNNTLNFRLKTNDANKPLDSLLITLSNKL